MIHQSAKTKRKDHRSKRQRAREHRRGAEAGDLTRKLLSSWSRCILTLCLRAARRSSDSGTINSPLFSAALHHVPCQDENTQEEKKKRGLNATASNNSNGYSTKQRKHKLIGKPTLVDMGAKKQKRFVEPIDIPSFFAFKKENLRMGFRTAPHSSPIITPSRSPSCRGTNDAVSPTMGNEPAFRHQQR